jgi:hypothetical protein
MDEQTDALTTVGYELCSTNEQQGTAFFVCKKCSFRYTAPLLKEKISSIIRTN